MTSVIQFFSRKLISLQQQRILPSFSFFIKGIKISCYLAPSLGVEELHCTGYSNRHRSKWLFFLVFFLSNTSTGSPEAPDHKPRWGKTIWCHCSSRSILWDRKLGPVEKKHTAILSFPCAYTLTAVLIMTITDHKRRRCTPEMKLWKRKRQKKEHTPSLLYI